MSEFVGQDVVRQSHIEFQAARRTRAQQRKPADSADELALVEACRPEIDARFRQFSVLANNSLRGVKDVATKPNNATIVAACTQRIRSLAGYVEADAKIAINGRKHAHAQFHLSRHG